MEIQFSLGHICSLSLQDFINVKSIFQNYLRFFTDLVQDMPGNVITTHIHLKSSLISCSLNMSTAIMD